MIQLGKTPTITLMLLLLASTFTPSFAEVTSFVVDKTFYTKGDQISFSGTIQEADTGLVTIVIRDSNGDFVLLTQAFMQPDNTFQRDLDTDKKFEDHGIHNATAFITDLAKGQTISFDISQDGTLPNPSITLSLTKQVEQNEPILEDNSSPQTISEPVLESSITLANFVDPTKDPQYYLDRYYNESAYKEWFDNNYPGLTIEEAVGVEPPKVSTLANFVDPTKDPQYYLDRYYNESAYKEWFDNNYPGLTIEEAVGLKTLSTITETIEENLENVIPDEVIPEAEAVQTVATPLTGNNSETNEMALLGLTLGGLAILFGAIYGIKRKVDTNSENISINRESIKKKMFGALHWNSPEDVIKNRLAHGEISVKEYSIIKHALENN